jgi:hypothetical protein
MAPAVELAKAIATTDFVPRALRNNPAAIAAAILYGDEVGLGPMQSLAKIAVIDGRPFIAAEAQRALVYAAGHDLWLDEATNTKATWCGRRHGTDQVTRITWTMDDARRAHLDAKPNWRSYPRAMLSARASAELVRAAFADVVGGLRALEELDEFEPGLVGLPAGPAAALADPPAGTRRRARARAARAPVPPTSPPDDWSAAPAGRRRLPLPGESLEAEPDPAPPDRWPGAPEPEGPAPAPMTGPQRRRMMALFRERAIGDRAERLRLSAEWIGRPIATASELTSREADRIIDVLESLAPAEPEPAPLDVDAVDELGRPIDVTDDPTLEGLDP